MASVPQDDHIRADVREPVPLPTISSTTTVHERPDRPLRLAIVGGGIGGLCLALGLRKHSHIDVQIYEAAHKFSEIGAGIGVGKNAQRSLELLGPDVYAAYKKQATEAPFRICNGQAEGELGSAVLMPPNIRASQSTVHRAQFLDALVELVPSGWAHFDKRLVKIEDKTAEGGSLLLNFKDGTTVEADAIIGADGIHSHTRAHVLDDVPDKEKYRLQYSGAVVYRSVIPMDKVVQALGTDIAQYSSLFMMDGAMMVSYPVDHNERLNAAAYTWEHKTWDKKEWVAPVSREGVMASYRGMQPLDPKINELLNVSCDNLIRVLLCGNIDTDPPPLHSSSKTPPHGQSGTSPTSPNTTAAQSASWATQPTPPAPSTAREPGRPSKTPSLSPTTLRM
jgi:salicylate hydroxylase